MVSPVKETQIASQECYGLCGAYMAQSTLFRRDMFVWVDESGSVARDQYDSR